jgi:hypothetical protein
MKNSILIFITSALFISNINAQMGWFQQNSTTFVNLQDIKMLNSNTAFVAGFYPDGYGWVFRTTNAGTTWTVSYQTQNPLNQLESVSFASATTGTAVGGLFSGSLIYVLQMAARWFISHPRNYYHMQYKHRCKYRIYQRQLGTIFKTTAAAQHGRPTSGTIHRLYAMAFINASTGIIAVTENNKNNKRRQAGGL